MNKEEYISWVAPRIVLDSIPRNLLPSPRIAQACFESAYGTSELAVNANNLFGVKNNDQWAGKCYSKLTKECYDGVKLEDVTADFRAYDSWEESITDQGDFLINRCTTPKYHPELKHYADLVGNRDYKDCARILAEKNYGTAKDYDQRVIDYVERHNLTQYDSMTMAEAEAMIAKERTGMKILLTVGHSILKTGQCTSADGRPYGGILEYSYNKGISERIAGYLRLVGYEVDVLVCPELRFAKSTEEKGYKLMRANSAGYDLVVELHLNASGLHNAQGSEVLYLSEDEKEIAQRIQAQLATVFRDRGVKQRNNLYMLTQTKPPTVLVESFFCDNSDDCAIAEDTDVALLIAKGIYGDNINAAPQTETTAIMYRVQVGAFASRTNAERLLGMLHDLGFDAFITELVQGSIIYRVQVGAYSVKANALAMQERLRAAGFESFLAVY